MTSQRSFYRKIAYLLAMVPILMLLRCVGAPAGGGAQGSKEEPGGVLAQLRAEHGLSEAQIGEIDPTSETIKLATLGMRGVAANVLWQKANQYKMKKDWTNLSATLQQIAKVEPHFIAVWRFQAWNLSYNVSAEFDDYRKRYEWVIKGIDFLKEGIRHNAGEARLVWDLGWFTSQKIGRADEYRQFRRLFREDDDFHGSRPVQDRDNWLVGKEWFARAENLVDQGAPLRGMSPVIFYSSYPMSQMNHCEAIEEEGVLGEKARRGWSKAGREWHDYGNRGIPTSYGDTIHLNDREENEETAKKLREQLEAMAPGVRERLAAERRAQLSKEQREVLDLAPAERTEQQHELAFAASRKLRVTHEDVARQLTGAQRSRALEVAEKLSQAERLSGIITRYRDIVNFEYWRRRAKVEQTDEVLEARRLIYEGTQALAEGRLPEARERYDAGLAKWREVLDLEQFPNLIGDQNLGRDLIDVISVYRKILDARDEPFPDNFVLQDVLERYGDYLEN